MLLFNNINQKNVADDISPKHSGSGLQFGMSQKNRTLLADTGKRSQSMGIAKPDSDSKSNY